MRTVGFFDPVDLRDVGMIQRCEHLRLPPEAGEAIGVGRERVGKDLQRDIAIQLRVVRQITWPIPPAPSTARKSYAPTVRPTSTRKRSGGRLNEAVATPVVRKQGIKLVAQFRIVAAHLVEERRTLAGVASGDGVIDARELPPAVSLHGVPSAEARAAARRARASSRA